MKFYARPFDDDRRGGRDDGGSTPPPGRGGSDDPLGLRRRTGRKRAPSFTADPDFSFDYKDPQTLRHFITERGKVVPRRISGNCAKHQRKVALAIKRARMIALMPFAVTGE